MNDQSGLLNKDKSLEEGSSKGCRKIALVTVLVLCIAAVVVVVIFFVPPDYEGQGTESSSAASAVGCALSNGGCDGICTEEGNDTVCSCGEGFLLGEDGKACDDINECEVNQGGCNHICSNTEGSYDCLCHAGFALTNDNHTCAAQLFYSDRKTGIHSILPETLESTTVLEGEGPYGIDFDCRNGMLYWSSVKEETISRGQLNNGILENPEILVDAGVGLEYPTDIAVDTINNNLYWSDFNAEHIGLLTMDDNNVVINLIADMKKRDPLAVAVNPNAGQFYWAYAANIDLTKRDFGVMNSTLDGASSVPLVTELAGISGLKYDSKTNSVCWCDRTTTIECINLDDSSRHVITNEGKQPFDVAFTEDTIYWISIELNDILYLPRNDTGVEIQALNITALEPRGITLGARC